MLSDRGAIEVQPASALRGATQPLTFSFRVDGRADRLLARSSGTLAAPGDTKSFSAKNEGAPVLDVAPGAPTDVRATPGAAGATVSWKAPATGRRGTPQRYLVTVRPGGTQLVAYAPATSLEIPGLRPGTPYTFTVTAENRAGKGPESDPSRAAEPLPMSTTPPTTTPTTGGRSGRTALNWNTAEQKAHPAPPVTKGVPGAPTDLSLDPWVPSESRPGGTTLDGALYWDAPADEGDSPITGWLIIGEQMGPDGWGGTQVGRVEGAETGLSLIDSFGGQKPPARFRIQVAALNSQGEGPASQWLEFEIGCDVYGDGIGPEYMVRTLCEHDPLSQ